MYTASSLCAVLEGVGFVDVAPKNFQEGELPDLKSVDNRPEGSIYVEGRKPARS